MNKNIVLILGTLGLLSCNQVHTNSQNTVTQGTDTISKVEISINKEDTILSNTPKLLFRATGSEPGWLAEFYDNKLRLLLNYGSDSLSVNDNFQGVESQDGYKYQIPNSLEVEVNNKPCIDAASGDKAEREVIIKYKNKTYKGCGSFVK